MDQHEDFGGGRALFQRADDVAVGDDVGLEFARFDVEDEDEDGDAAEDVGALVGEVVLDEAVLSARGVNMAPALLAPSSFEGAGGDLTLRNPTSSASNSP